MKRALKIFSIFVPLLLTGALFAIFQSTDPASIGPGGILGVFVLLYLTCFSLLFIVVRFGLYVVIKAVKSRRSTGGAGIAPTSVRKAYYIASVLAFVPVVLLAMHAYSQLQLTDGVLVGVLMAVVIFYILKRY